MKNWKKYICLITVFFLFISIIFNHYFLDLILYFFKINENFLKMPFIAKSDYLIQHIMFYEDFFRMLDCGNLGWSWNYLLGAEIVATKSYYMVGDIYAYLGFFLHKFYDYTPAILFALTIIKSLFSYLIFYKFLGFFCKKNLSRIIGAIGYAFSGFFLVFIEQPMFISFYSLFPLWLICVEHYLKNNKRQFVILLPISTALIIGTNILMAYSGCFFLLIYWIVRNFQIGRLGNFANFIKDSFRFLFIFLIGVTLVTVIWVPFLNLMKDSPRVESNFGIPHLKIRDINSYIRGFYLPLMITYDDGQFKGTYYVAQFAQYSGIINFLLTQFWIYSTLREKKKESLSWLTVILLLICCLFLPITWILICISPSLRWTYFFNIIILLLASQMLEKIDFRLDKYFIVILIINFIVLLSLKYAYQYYFRVYFSYVYLEFVICFILLLIFAFILLFLKEKRLALVLLISCEFLVFPKLALSFNVESPKKINEVLFESNEDIMNTYDSLKNYDSSFYRVIFPDFEPNYGTYLGIPTVTSYDSTYQNSVEPYYLKYNLKDPNFWIIDSMRAVKDGDIEALAEGNVKYLISKTMLENNNLFKLINLGTPFYIYELVEPTGLGKVISNNNNYYCNPVEITNNLIRFKFNNIDGVLELKIPYISNWEVEIDGTPSKTFKSEDGFLRVILNNTREVYFKYNNRLITLSLYIMFVSIIVWALEIRKAYEEK